MGIKLRWIFLFIFCILSTAFILFASDARLIDLHIKAGKLDEALEMYDKLLQFQPKNAQLHIEAGQVNLLAGYENKALQQFEKACLLGVHSEQLLSDLYHLYQKDENREKMIEMLNGLLALQPGNESLHLQMAELYEWNAQPQKALQHYQLLADKDPLNAEYLLKISAIYRHMRQFGEAIPRVEKYVQIRPNDRSARFLLADLHLASGNTGRASELFEEILQQDKENLAIREKLAEIYTWKNKPGKAFSHLEYLANRANTGAQSKKQFLQLAQRYEPLRAIRFLENRLKADTLNVALRQELADLFLYLGRPHAALFHLQKQLENEPKNNDAREKIARLLVQIDEPVQAQKYYRAIFDYGDTSRSTIDWLLQSYSFRKQYHELLNLHQDMLDRQISTYNDRRAWAQTLFKTGKLIPAISAYSKLLAQKPEDAETRVELAYALEADGQSPEANRILSQGLDEHKLEGTEYLLTCLRFFSRENSPDRSLTCYRLLAQKFPENSEYNRGLRQELIRNGNYREALTAIDEWSQTHPTTLKDQVQIAMLYWKLGNTKAMRQALPKAGADLNEQRQLAAYFFDAAMFDEAIGAALKVIRQVPADSALLRTIGLAYAWNNRPHMAMKILQKFHRDYSGDYESHYHLAEIYRSNNKQRQARVEFEKSLHLLDAEIQRKNSRLVRARILASQGELVKARTIYKNLLQDSPADIYVQLDYISTLIAADALDEAAAKLNNFRRIRPNDIQAKQLQSTLYFKQGRPRKSLQILEQIAKTTSVNSGQLLDMADLHFMLGDWSQAKDNLEAALKIDPQNEAARLRLFRLRRDNFPAFASEFEFARQSNRFEKQVYSALCAIARTRPLQLFLRMESVQLFDNNAADSTTRYNTLNIHTISRLSDRLRLRSRLGINQTNGESDISANAVATWIYRGADAVNFRYVHKDIWQDLQYATYLGGRQSGLKISGNLHMANNWNFQGSYARYANSFADTSLTMGSVQYINLQTGYNFKALPGLNLNYNLYSYSYSNINQSLELASFLENETVHNLGTRYSYSTPRFYFDFGGSVGYRMHNADLTYYGDLNLEYMLLRNFRFGSTMRYGSDKELLVDGQTFEVLLNLGIFY